MPIPNQTIGSTAPKSGTLQFIATRLQGLTLKFGPSAGVTEIPNTRIVSIQEETATKKMFAVVSPIALAGHTIIGWGVLEESLQSGGVASIAPTPNNYKAGDTVTVLTGLEDVYMIDVDPDNIPANGIAVAYLDLQGRLTSDDTTYKLNGAVFTAVPGVQLSNQLKTNSKLFRFGFPFLTVETP